MNTPRYAAAAAKLIANHLPAPKLGSGDEARGVATIERALRARARRRRLVAFGSLCAAAATLVLGLQLARPTRSSTSAATSVSIDVSPSGQGASLAFGANEQPLPARASLESGQRIDTPADGGASLRLSSGTSMALAGQTSFRVDSQGAVQRFSLQHGELSAHVAKLTGAQRFIVNTPDAEVEVRGTRFHLKVVEAGEACGDGTRTRLEVTEGVVEVRAAGLAALSVKAGQSWPTDCATQPDAASPVPTAISAARANGPGSLPKAEVRPRAPATVSDEERASALAPQNDLFAEGTARSRQGDTGGALRAYQELISRFPNSPLAENGMVARMRLLAGFADGRAEAKRYLNRYPHGFAIDEATKLSAEP